MSHYWKRGNRMNFEDQFLSALEDIAGRQTEISSQQAAMQATLNAILSELQKPAPPSTLLSEIAGLLRDLLSKLDNWRGPLSTK